MPENDPDLYYIHAPEARGTQVGNNNTQHNTFVLKAGAVAVVAVTGVALTFMYQAWEGEKKPSSGSSSADLASGTRPTWPQDDESEDETPTPTPGEESATPTDEPTTDEPSTPSFDPTTLDDALTDRTPITVNALLPAAFTDSKGVRYTRNSEGVVTCDQLSRNSEATTTLVAAGCVDDEVATGTYLDRDQNVLVAVEVMALADKATAVVAHSRLKDSNAGGWRYRCPTIGVGANVCRDSGLAQATWDAYTVRKHRYVISAVAVYVDLRQDESVKSWLTTASYEANRLAGPENHPANQ
ncbi:hypothetical protein [Streptomyces sp. NPDC056464]|uniref:hypothetical protein n=1 Tax=Streptomyces sp. NPDC056464 TaxID=3345828 RepID=UPI00369CA40C